MFYICSMYLQFNTKKSGKKVYKSVLLCHKYREAGVPKTRVILNLSKLPDNAIAALKVAFSKTNEQLVAIKDIVISRIIDYGYVLVLLTIMDRLRITEVFNKSYSGNVKLVRLMIIGKLVTRGSKLSIFNWINRNTWVANKLDIDTATLKVDHLYEELADLSRTQNKIERKWNVYHKARHHNIFLYDITSIYFEGTKNELAAFGYNRDGKKGKLQITVGLITDNKGFPLKIQVFEGNINDHKTVCEQLRTLKESFGAEHIILVGDRGMRIRMNLEQMEHDQKQGIEYISALSSEEIRSLVKEQTIQLSFFSKELVEIQKDDIRYILCTNTILEEEKNNTRESLKQRFEQNILLVKDAWQNRHEKNEQNIIRIKQGAKNKKLVTSFSENKLDNYKFRATNLINKYKMSKFYDIKISNDEFSITFNLEKYQKEKLLDGKYIIETTVKKEEMGTAQVREEYKNLQNVERGFRDLKTERIHVRPVFHRKEAQTRGHIFICMFAYAIIREIENVVFPWLKLYNKENKCRLAFQDIEEELKNIKAGELQLGCNMKTLKIPTLNPIQNEVLKLLKIKPERMLV